MLDFSHTEHDLVKYIGRILRTEAVISEGLVSYKLTGSDADHTISFEMKEIKNILEILKAKKISDGTALYSETSYEILVNEEGGHPPWRRSTDYPLSVQDTESGMTYEISLATNEYMVWLIGTAHENGLVRDIGLASLPPRFFLRRLIEESPDLFSQGFDKIRKLFPRLVTLKIQSDSKLTLRRFRALTNSFFFHLGYNLDIAFAPKRFLDEASRGGRIRQMRRSKSSELDPPRRIYNEDLVNRYILAISTDSPTVQFLSFYHIIENFFEAVFHDDLIDQVKNTLTEPSFSYKRKKDVVQLISTITKAQQIRSDSVTFSETNALKLTLKRYIDVQKLEDQLSSYDPYIFNYYKSEAVSFSGGCSINLNSGNHDQIIKELASRIYSTRNALVHSKDGDKARFTPFRDEHILAKEVPLMRFVAEMVVLGSSEIV